MALSYLVSLLEQTSVQDAAYLGQAIATLCEEGLNITDIILDYESIGRVTITFQISGAVPTITV